MIRETNKTANSGSSKNNGKGKIFFVYPPSVVMNREDRCQMPLKDFVYIPKPCPFDMMLLSSIAKKRGFETKFYDYSIKNESVYDFLRDIREYQPDFLVINVASITLEDDLSILKEAQDLLENTIVIAKGAPFNFNSYVIMQKFPEIDIALRGEIEEAFDEIIQYKNLKNIEGITYHINEKIVSTKDRVLKDNLDYLPFLDRDLIDNSRYVMPDTKMPQTIIKVEKGCPYHCFFCLASVLYGKKARYRRPELVIEEIEECINKYNITDFIFWSDLFTADKSWVEKLCNSIIDKNLKIRFCANTRIDTIDFDTLKLMKRAGCTMLSCGIETGSQEILDKIGKNITLEQIKNTISMIKKARIQVYAYYVIGLPWETKETIQKTYKFAKELNTEFASFYSAVAFCGTKFYDYALKNRLGTINYEKPYTYPSIKSYELTAEEIYNYNKKFNRDYYLRPSYILKMLINADSITKLKTYYDNFVKLMRREY